MGAGWPLSIKKDACAVDMLRIIIVPTYIMNIGLYRAIIDHRSNQYHEYYYYGNLNSIF